MNTDCSIARAASFSVLLFSVILIFSSYGLAQTLPTGHALPKPTPDLEKRFLVNILNDQRAIWTSPFHMNGGDAKWLGPLGVSTMALIATDRRTSGELVENGDNLNRLRISHYISRLGLTGRATHNEHLRETGLLAAEALIDSGIVVSALKTVSQRQRPTVDHSSGEFFDGGSAFPSGHASSAWSVATVIAQEYGHHRPLVQVGAYGLAAAVSMSRYTGRNHFLSDVVVGSAIGYGIGRYVYHKRHDPGLDARNGAQNNEVVVRSKLFPRITPLYYPRAHVYGGMLAWNF
jgi:membrane-associated phospholipid phosphatase